MPATRSRIRMRRCHHWTRRVRRVRGAGAVALRELSRRVAPAARRDAAARRGGVRVRARRRRHRRRGKRAAGRTSGAASAVAGSAPSRRRRRRRRRWRRRRERSSASDRDDLIALALGHSIRSLDLPLSLFDDLLSAFGQDTMTTRYASWADVFDYCRRSANPVGRLVLRIGGYRDDALDRSSDALCTALQLTNFWQDFGRDWRAGRLYVPRDEQVACGARRNGSRGRTHQSRLEPRSEARGRSHARAVRGGATRVRRRDGPAPLRAAPHVARRRPHSRARRSGRDRLLDHRPTLGASDVPLLLWRAVAVESVQEARSQSH